MDLVVICYEITRHFPKEEVFGLSSQLKRSTVSVPANIAEGHGRLTRGEYINFLRIAQGSLQETETHLLIASRLNFITDEQLKAVIALIEEIGKMLNGLISKLINK